MIDVRLWLRVARGLPHLITGSTADTGPPTVYRLLCVNNVTNVVSASRTQTSPVLSLQFPCEIHPYAVVFTSLMEQ